MRLALLAMLLTACTNVHVNRAALVASTAALACDWHKTRTTAARDSMLYTEHNPLLGDDPSAGAVDMYFVSTIVINAAIWYVLPKRWRSVLPVVVATVQVTNETRDQMRNQFAGANDIPVCGIW